MPQALVLDQALVVLHTVAVIGDYAMRAPQTGRGSPLGTVLQLWRNAVRRTPAAPPPAAREGACVSLPNQIRRKP